MTATAIAISGMGLTGVLRLTWAHDNLGHVLEHSQTDETPGTWTGLACPSHGLPLGADVDNAVLQEMAAGSELADLIWEPPDEFTTDHAQAFKDAMCAHLAGDAERASQLWQNLQAIWSHAWSANYAVLEFMQGAGLTRFSPVKPQRWVVASFEHHTSPHGLPQPHVHNIVISGLTTRCNLLLRGVRSKRRTSLTAGHGAVSTPGHNCCPRNAHAGAAMFTLRPQSEPPTSLDAIMDGGRRADMRRANTRVIGGNPSYAGIVLGHQIR